MEAVWPRLMEQDKARLCELSIDVDVIMEAMKNFMRGIGASVPFDNPLPFRPEAQLGLVADMHRPYARPIGAHRPLLLDVSPVGHVARGLTDAERAEEKRQEMIEKEAERKATKVIHDLKKGHAKKDDSGDEDVWDKKPAAR